MRSGDMTFGAIKEPLFAFIIPLVFMMWLYTATLFLASPNRSSREGFLAAGATLSFESLGGDLSLVMFFPILLLAMFDAV